MREKERMKERNRENRERAFFFFSNEGTQVFDEYELFQNYPVCRSGNGEQSICVVVQIFK